jgi:hypothetical protein
MLKIDPDSKFLVYSYLKLEEILILLKHNTKLRDKVIYRYFPVLPTIREALGSDNLEILKYLFEVREVKEIKEQIHELDDNDIYEALDSGNIGIGKFLVEQGIKPSSSAFSLAVSNNNLNLANFLVKYMDKLNDNDIIEIIGDAIEYVDFDTVKYLISLVPKISPKDIKNFIDGATKNGDLNLLKYIIKLGTSYNIKPTYENINTACKYNHFEILKFFIGN